ncbi:hypothetical protein [Actinoplanes sp. NPDC048796]|uniref:hypothetical protein n=1 Tax=Actinoplanes sp. NPDC048796 TaxID=3155640 RepID=UPI0033E51417
MTDLPPPTSSRSNADTAPGEGSGAGSSLEAGVPGPYPRGGSSPGGPAQRRWWLIGVVGAWIVVVAALAVWSVGHERATVPEQRAIALAVTDLQRAAGALVAAAEGPGRAVVLGELELVDGCRVTPVREGVAGARDVTVHVPRGELRTTMESISKALPGGYRTELGEGRGGTRLSFHSDAGDFIGIDGTAEATAQVLTLRLSTGCRPRSDDLDRRDPPAGSAPALFQRTVQALGQGDTPETFAALCPNKSVVATYVAAGVPMSKDLAAALATVTDGAEVIRADKSVRAYRVGPDSLVVSPDGDLLKVSVTTACGQ